MRKPNVFPLFVFCLTLLVSAVGHAAGETEFTLQQSITSVVPMFLEGHPGDMTKVKGFTFTGDTLMNGQSIGNTQGEVRLWNPPLTFTDAYGQVFISVASDIAGFGRFEYYGQGVALGSSTSASAGDMVIAWSGSITNGSDQMADSFGLVAGVGIANIFTGTGTATETLRLRFGY